MTDSLLLDVDTWDLIIDADRNMALCAAPYAVAQDVASAVRTFTDEVIFDLNVGIPYFEEILGNTPPLQLVQGRITTEALTVPNVSQARTLINKSREGAISGEIQIIDTAGEALNVSF
jgi:hypothetical protein